VAGPDGHRAFLHPRKLLGVGFPGEPASVEWLLGEMEVAVPPETLNAVAAELRTTDLRFGPAPHEDGVYRFVVRVEAVAEDRTVPPLEEFMQRASRLTLHPGTGFMLAG
jgi:hypothetical protein